MTESESRGAEIASTDYRGDAVSASRYEDLLKDGDRIGAKFESLDAQFLTSLQVLQRDDQLLAIHRVLTAVDDDAQRRESIIALFDAWANTVRPLSREMVQRTLSN